MSPAEKRYKEITLHPERRRGAMLLLLALLALLPAGVPGEAGEAGGRDEGGTPGVRVTMKVPFASESLDAVNAATPARKARFLGNRAIPRNRIDRVPTSRPFDASAASPLSSLLLSAPNVTPQAPLLDNSFAGLGNPPLGEDVIPPDTMGAAGPNHLVSLLNSDFGVFEKTTGALIPPAVDLQSFWASLGTGPGEPAHFPFDPKILYDQHSGRFIAVTLGGRSSPSSWIMIAVSASENAKDVWHKWAIDADKDNDLQLFNNSADYPGFGVDAYNVYVTANMFDINDDYQYSKVWVIPKAQLLTGTDSDLITWYEFRDPTGKTGLNLDASMQPAHTFGNTSAEYLVFEDLSSVNRLLLARIDNVAGIPVWHQPTIVVVNPYDFLLLGAPQAADSRTIDTTDTRLLNAVYRNDSLWTTHTVAANGKTEVAWYRINPAAGAVVTQGRIRDSLRWFYFPSIAVNANDVAAIGFSGSSTQEYAGGYYTLVRAGSSTAEPVSLLKSGKAAYYKTLSGTINRWGDFSATMVDPTDDLSFWTLQEYAKTPIFDGSKLVSQWGTWWGKFRSSDVTAPSGLSATVLPLPQVVLNWTDASGNLTGFKVERRRLPGEDYTPIMTLLPNITTFTDNAATGLLVGNTYTYRVLAFNATGGSYSGEAFATIPSTIPNPALTSLSPSSATAGNTGFTLTVTGTGLVSDSVVRWNGMDRTTTYISGTQLTAAIQTSDIAVAGLNSVTVYNPSPNGVTSNGLTFTVVAPPPPPPPSGGGGGGCLAMAPSSGARAEVSSILSVAILFLPAAVYGWRRRLRPGNR